jgi:hypothetical protein
MTPAPARPGRDPHRSSLHRCSGSCEGTGESGSSADVRLVEAARGGAGPDVQDDLQVFPSALTFG